MTDAVQTGYKERTHDTRVLKIAHEYKQIWVQTKIPRLGARRR